MKIRSAGFITILLFSCSGYKLYNTDISSAPDPAFHNRQYKSIAVEVRHDDFVFQKQLEDEIAMVMQWYSIEAHTMTILAPPTRKWTDSDIKDILRSRDIQAILVVDYSQFKKDSFYVARQTIIEDNIVSVMDSTEDGRIIETQERKISETHGRPMRTQGSQRVAEVGLYDFISGSKAWYGKIDSYGYLSSSDKMRDIAKAIMNELQNYGIVR